MPKAAESCKKKVRLMEQYADAAHLFSRAVKRLLRDGHNTSKFSVGREAVNRAKEKCNRASLALDKHCGSHSC
jgi:hypothetical protein